MIDHFDGDYKFLSSFYPAEVMFENIVYPSVEHAYQAAKTKDWDTRIAISLLPTPGQAKRAGKKIKLTDDWHIRKLVVMADLVHQKFANPERRALLIATDGQELIEGNYWGDKFWGVHNGKGKNHLGKLLMAERNAINMGLA